MSVLALSLGLASSTCCGVNNLQELRDPIVYADRSRSYYLAVRGRHFRIGRTLDRAVADVPQFSGEIRNCGSTVHYCRLIGYLVFALPRNYRRLRPYNSGVSISFRRNGSGIRAMASCPRVSRRGCVTRSDGASAAIMYEYAVNSSGTITHINIQHFDSEHNVLESESLNLVTRRGLQLH